MKKKTTTAILLATTMMLALMGCGAASESSSDAKAPVAEINEKADIDSADTDKEEKDDTDIEADEETSTESAAPADSAAIAESAIEYKGETFTATDDLKTSLAKADSISKIAPGYPLEMQEKNSLYYYDVISEKDSLYGIGISTFNENDVETVNQIFSNDPSSKTSKGIHPGSTKDELLQAYGEPTKIVDNSYVYDDCHLLFIVNNNEVTMISSENPVWAEKY